MERRSVLEELIEQENRAPLPISDKGSFLILSQLGIAPDQLVHSLIKPMYQAFLRSWEYSSKREPCCLTAFPSEK